MSDTHHHPTGAHSDTIHLPSPTAWPIILAFGVTMLFGGMVTNGSISILGGVLCLFAAVGWFRQVLPHEAHEDVPVQVEHIVIETKRTEVARLVVPEDNRAHLPVESYPVLSGLKGGVAGGIAMIPPALIYGLIAQHSIWYPVNLLGGAGVANWLNPSVADLAAFHWQGLIVASVIHVITCLLVGLLYGAMLPMLPRHPIVLGGVVAPVLWTGLLHSTMGVINPVLRSHIAWGWFLISQIVFGLVAGWVVAHQERINTGQSRPFLMRMGIEAPGLMHVDHHDERNSGDES
ncbi:hypothetical protein [Silvibacterium acidisoli]|uniref:hypothetical protein n=1 Tax=Acidobacteriaceae bacterium ZG23-2 TaxID=2883246 RepID=UPI00406BE21C